jgi:hypothetical protein
VLKNSNKNQYCKHIEKLEPVLPDGFPLAQFINVQGVEPRWKGLNTVIPVIMVSKRAYTILVAESLSSSPGKQVLLSFREDIKVSSAVWEPLEKLVDGDGWPRSDAYIAKKYEQLVEEHNDWPDRVSTLQYAYSQKVNASPTITKGGNQDTRRTESAAGANSEL